jgi:alpha-tubulin suppressor-like RCC1 family protein
VGKGRSVLALLAALTATACGGPSASNTPKTVEPPPRKLIGGTLFSCLTLPAEAPVCWGIVVPSREALTPDPTMAKPRAIAGTNKGSLLASNAGGLCILDAGRVRCAGVNMSVQSSEAFSPVELPERAIGLAVGGTHACALLADRQVACWGGNLHGQSGEPMGSVAFPQVVTGVDDVTALALGMTHSCALRRGGQVSCWGHNEAGMLGDGVTVSHARPSPVVDLKGVTRITAGRLHSCALRSDGTVVCWGLGDDGQLGDGKERSVDGFASRPVDVVGLSGITEISAGHAHTCALGKNGQVWCWGANGNGQLGDGTTTSRTTPALVPELRDVVEIAAGGGHQCALRADQSVFCWGNSAVGQTGQASSAPTLRPTLVPLR